MDVCDICFPGKYSIEIQALRFKKNGQQYIQSFQNKMNEGFFAM